MMIGRGIHAATLLILITTTAVDMMMEEASELQGFSCMVIASGGVGG